MFQPIQKDSNYFFAGCDSCFECCKYPFIPLILEDFEYVYNRFPILFAYIDSKLRAVILLGDKDECRYLKDGKCSIYEERPPSCKLYPITPFYADCLIDTGCKAVGDTGRRLVHNGVLQEEFRHKRVDNFETKLQETERFLLEVSDTLVFATHRRGFELFRIDHSSGRCDEYTRLHMASLVHLDG